MGRRSLWAKHDNGDDADVIGLELQFVVGSGRGRWGQAGILEPGLRMPQVGGGGYVDDSEVVERSMAPLESRIRAIR